VTIKGTSKIHLKTHVAYHERHTYLGC
jgi:hypothetical protein